MISHALLIVSREMSKHLKDVYESDVPVVLGNLAEGVSNSETGDQVPRNSLVLSVVNIREEKSLKNVPNYIRDDVALKVRVSNAPVYLNLQILVTATNRDYKDALTMLSRAILFFQSRNVFTQDTVDVSSLAGVGLMKAPDQLTAFKLIFDLYSPSMEEVNHLWGTLGGKQYPFAIYTMRMLELRLDTAGSDSGLITEVQSIISHKPPIEQD